MYGEHRFFSLLIRDDTRCMHREKKKYAQLFIEFYHTRVEGGVAYNFSADILVKHS